MKIKFDSRQRAFKTPFGAVRRNERCTLRLMIPRRFAILQAVCHIERDGGDIFNQPMAWSGLSKEGYDIYETRFALPRCGLYFYHFEAVRAEGRQLIYRLGDTDVTTGQGERWQLTCFDENYVPPKGFSGGVMYQIFPDRFYRETLCEPADKLKPFWLHGDPADVPAYQPDENGVVQNNDFFGGNLAGIVQKLPYLQHLGATILYLNPIFMAYSNHRYDTADYKRIDPLLGDETAFSHLCEQAHRRGMKLILDGVFSHTGSNSVYFDKENVFGGGAYHNPDSPYREWYDFSSDAGGYTSWWGIDTLPCVVEERESYIKFIIEDEDSVVAHWLKLGADGFRLDVADELPDGFIQRLTRRVKQLKPDAVVIGEVWEDASNKISYGKRRAYFTAEEGLELDSVMNYPFRSAIIDAVTGRCGKSELESRVMTIADHYPAPVLCNLMNSLSTHDTPRILTLLGETPPELTKEERAIYQLSENQLSTAIRREKAAAFLQFFLPGIPCVYYGDEAGMEGFEDPFNRCFFPWGKENSELQRFYRELIQAHRMVKPESYVQFCPDFPDQVTAFRRGKLTCLCNLSGSAITLPAAGCKLRFACSARQEDGQLILDGYGCAVLEGKI